MRVATDETSRPALEHAEHFVPRGVHFASIDALHGDPFKDDFSPVDTAAIGEDAEQGDLSA